MRALLETLRLTAIWAWPVIPGKCEELWGMLRLPGTPGETRGAAAAASFGPGEPAGEKLAEVKSLFPRLEVRTDAQA
jgi:methionyl-tRNA synthetase